MLEKKVNVPEEGDAANADVANSGPRSVKTSVNWLLTAAYSETRSHWSRC